VPGITKIPTYTEQLFFKFRIYKLQIFRLLPTIFGKTQVRNVSAGYYQNSDIYRAAHQPTHSILKTEAVYISVTSHRTIRRNNCRTEFASKCLCFPLKTTSTWPLPDPLTVFPPSHQQMARRLAGMYRRYRNSNVLVTCCNQHCDKSCQVSEYWGERNCGRLGVNKRLGSVFVACWNLHVGMFEDTTTYNDDGELFYKQGRPIFLFKACVTLCLVTYRHNNTVAEFTEEFIKRSSSFIFPRIKSLHTEDMALNEIKMTERTLDW
jgi:hypothetical protein